MSQNTSSNKPPKVPDNLKELLQIAARPFVFLLAIIMVCAFLAHYLTDSETLEEYARNNPKPSYEDTDDTGAADTLSADPDQTDADSVLDDSSTEPASAAPLDSPVNEPDTPDISSEYNIPDEKITESDDMKDSAERTTYQPGFYYEPLSDSIKQRITGVSYPETGCTVPYEDLNYVGLLYIDFNGDEQIGELICHRAIAQDMVEIFYELYQNQYQIERIRLIDEYGGDDTLSMENNNTSCFNYRVVDGTTNLSKHALGCAIDINPFYNPYVVFNKDGSGETYISPKGSEVYADRSQNFPYKIDENDLCYKLFIEHGFTWGGNWNSCKDYQHFQIVL